MNLFKRPLKALLLTLAAYLMDVCLMPYLTVSGISGSMSFAVISILTVSYGKKAAFVSGAIIGLLMECMLSSVPVVYLLMYPVIASLCAQFFADMSDRQRERRRTVEHKRDYDLPPFIRIVACAALSAVLMHTVNLVYGYLSGHGITVGHIMRALASVLYTIALAVVLMLPVRYFLGIYGTRKERREKRGER